MINIDKLSECSRCSTLFQPGFNCRIKLKKINELNRETRVSERNALNAVEYTCFKCGERTTTTASTFKPPKLVPNFGEGKDKMQNKNRKRLTVEQKTNADAKRMKLNEMEKKKKQQSFKSLKKLAQASQKKEKRENDLQSFLSSL